MRSSKGDLHSEGLFIFNICCTRGISIDMEWIPRTQNDSCHADDWDLSWNTFQNIDLVWGSHSIDRFAKCKAS